MNRLTKDELAKLRPADRPIRDEWLSLSPELRDAITHGYAPDPWGPAFLTPSPKDTTNAK